MKTELEKLDDGDEYCFFDEAVVTRKENALRLCKKFNTIDESEYSSILKVNFKKCICQIFF